MNRSLAMVILMAFMLIVAITFVKLEFSKKPSGNVTHVVSQSVDITALNPKAMAESSDIVILGTIKELLPSKKAKLTDVASNQELPIIYTDYRVAIDEIWGQASSLGKVYSPRDEIFVRLVGGTVGNETSDPGPDRHLELAKTYVFFLRMTTAKHQPDRPHFYLTGLFDVDKTQGQVRAIVSRVNLGINNKGQKQFDIPDTP